MCLLVHICVCVCLERLYMVCVHVHVTCVLIHPCCISVLVRDYSEQPDWSKGQPGAAAGLLGGCHLL